MKRLLPLLAIPLLVAAAPAPKTPGDIVNAAPPGDWRTLDPDNTLYMRLASGGVVTIELAPDFAPVTVANIRALVRAHYFDGSFITREQDNYVVQWSADDAHEKAQAKLKGVAEFDRKPRPSFRALPDRDTYAPRAGFDSGFPAASDGRREWLVHCYGMVGAGRDNPPNSGTGVELYAVTGQAPRQLDRNITLVGRVVSGMAFLSGLPRGTGGLGFYMLPSQRTKIVSIRLARDEPQRTPLQVLRTDSASFHAYVEARRNRRDAWFVHPAGHIDVCNIPIPARPSR